jgi:hypothetical protein
MRQVSPNLVDQRCIIGSPGQIGPMLCPRHHPSLDEFVDDSQGFVCSATAFSELTNEVDVATHLPRTHDYGSVQFLEEQNRIGAFALPNERRLGIADFGFPNQLGNETAAYRIQYEVNTLVRPLILDVVRPEAIKYPTAAGLHMHRLAVAGEKDVGIRDDGNVYP